MKLILGLFAYLLITSCGSKSSSSDTTPAASPTWTEVKAALDAKCYSCHNNENITNCKINFTGSEALFKAAQACTSTTNTPGARVALTSGALKMPTSGTLTDAEKSAIINFK